MIRDISLIVVSLAFYIICIAVEIKLYKIYSTIKSFEFIAMIMPTA